MAQSSGGPQGGSGGAPGKDSDKGGMNTFARYVSLGILLPASTMVGYAMGYGLDHVFGTHALRIVFLLLGTVGGFIEFIRQLTRS
jgi:F0F1-type ATP synthase assembly protein I